MHNASPSSSTSATLFRAIGLLVLIVCAVDGAKRQIPVGGIFHVNNLEAERAFRMQLIRENMYNPRLEFIPVVRHIDPTDSFEAEKAACDLASEGVAAIFGPNTYQTSGIVASVCNNLGIPHILALWQPAETFVEPRSAFEKGEDDGAVDDDADPSKRRPTVDEVDDDGKPVQRIRPIRMDGPHAYTRNFFPDRALYSDVLRKLIEDSDWKGFTLIYDTADSLERLQDVLQIHEPNGNPVTVRQMPQGAPDKTDYKPLLKEIQLSGASHIMLDAAPAKVLHMLQLANSVKLDILEYQSYIITSLDAHTLDYVKLISSPSNITALRIMDPNSEEARTAVYDLMKLHPNVEISPSNMTGTEAALTVDAVKHFAQALRDFHSHREVQPRTLRCEGGGSGRRWEQGRHIVAALNQQTDHGMTGRILFDDNGKRADFYMEVLELSTEGFKKIATWNRADGITYMRSQIEVSTQISQSLHNKTVRVAVRLDKPWLMEKIVEEGVYLEGNDRFEGYSLDLIDGIAKILQFKYELLPVKGNKHGSYNKKTKKWDGLIKELLELKADLAVCDMTITYERRKVVDFTMPFMTLGISILFSKPHKESPPLFSFTNPLSIDVWIYMLTAYLCVSVVLFFVAQIAADDWENPHPCNDDPEELENLWNMHNCVWLTVGSIMQQGCDLLPKASSSRLVVSFWWFFALIVTSSYTANLAAFLTKTQMEKSISSAEDLSKQTFIKYGTLLGGSTMSFFKESNFSTYQKMWAVMENNPNVFVSNNDEGVERVIKDRLKYAFLCESKSIEYYVNRNCNLTQVGDLLDSKGYGIAIPMNSPYRTLISQTVLKMKESGTLLKLQEKWWKEMNINKNQSIGCDSDKDNDGDAGELGMANVGGVFLVLVVGCVFGILIGIIEFMWNLRQVVIENRITSWEAFKIELAFALDVRKTTKPVHIDSSSASVTPSRCSHSESLEERSPTPKSYEYREPDDELQNRRRRHLDSGGSLSVRHMHRI